MFEDVLGQPSAKQFLSSLLASKRMPHGLLFHGPSRVGKFALAFSFTKAINCRNDRRGYCMCTSCRKIDEGVHPDIKVIKPNEKGHITIEDIRALSSAFEYRRNEGVRKIALIKDAHKLRQQSANALLKTLEEPSPDTTVILTTSYPSKLFDTIRSRCQGVRHSFLSDEDIQRLAEKDDLDMDNMAVSMMAGSYAPERIRDELILFRHVWDGSRVEIPAKVEPHQLRSELVFLSNVFVHLLRTGTYQYRDIYVNRANSGRLSDLFSVMCKAVAYCDRQVRPYLVIQWTTNRLREVLV